MSKPHKHAELIKAWADGAEIQFLARGGRWRDCAQNQPEWNLTTEYRIKPEPKPDVVRTMLAGVNGIQFFCETQDGNLKLTFDGETGKLKSAEVLS